MRRVAQESSTAAEKLLGFDSGTDTAVLQHVGNELWQAGVKKAAALAGIA
jgi:hypothetical protein